MIDAILNQIASRMPKNSKILYNLHLRAKGENYLRIDSTNLNPFHFIWRTQILQKYVYIPNRIPNYMKICERE